MSLTARLDAATRALLERYGFDEDRFADLQRRVAARELSPRSNVVRGRVEPLPDDELAVLPAPEEGRYEEYRALGEAAIRRGEVVAAVLNGGMATRFGGVVKGIVDAYGGRSFLEWKLLDAERSGVALVVMNSFATDEATRAFVRENRLHEPLFFTQSV